MNDIDELLKLLRHAELPDKLMQLDGSALAATGHARRIEARNIRMVAAAVALLVGVAGSAVPSSTAVAASVTPFGAATAFAPSTLLASHP